MRGKSSIERDGGGNDGGSEWGVRERPLRLRGLCRRLRRTQHSQDPLSHLSAHVLLQIGEDDDRVGRVSQLSEFGALAQGPAVVSDERTAEIWSRDEAVAVIPRATLRLRAGMKAKRL